MAVQLSTDVRNDMLDAIDTDLGINSSIRIYSGTQPASCGDANSGTLLADITCNTTSCFNAAAAGAMAKNGTWQDASANGAGTAGHFRIYKDTGGTTCVVQGSCGQGTGDISFDNASISAGQTVTISTFTLNAANS